MYCDDCGTDRLNLFMVHNELWLGVAAKRAYLCLPCLEARLGRKVTLHDLKPCQITYAMYLGAYVALNTSPMPPESVLLDSELFTVGNKEIVYPGRLT